MSNVRSMKRHNLRLSVFLHTLLAVLSLLWLLPVAWLVLSSFRAEPGAYTSYLLPKATRLTTTCASLPIPRCSTFPAGFSTPFLWPAAPA